MESHKRHKAPSESERDSHGSTSSDSSSEEETDKRSKSSKETHAKWTATHDIAFADAMLEQILHGMTTKNGFNKKAWSQIRTVFYQKTGCSYTQRQLRNRKGVLKLQYKTLKQLSEQPGFNWHETRHMVTAEDAVWDDYLKVHPDAEKFRTLCFPVYDQLCIISGDTLPEGRLVKSSQPPPLEDITADDTQQSAQGQAETDEPACNALLVVRDKGSAYSARDPDVIQKSNKRRSLSPSSSSRSRRKESGSSDLAEAFYEFADALRCKNRSAAPASDPYAISRCIKELESIKGVTDEEVFGAIDVFRDPLLREAFMTMQPQRRLRWIRTQINIVP